MKTKKKTFSYPLHSDGYSTHDINAGISVLLSGQLTMSKKTKEFEKYFAKKIGAKYCLMVNSGSSANLLALFCAVNPLRKNHLKKKWWMLGPSSMLVNNIMAYNPGRTNSKNFRC